MTVGGLAFNLTTQAPLLMDNVILSYDPAAVPAELMIFSTD